MIILFVITQLLIDSYRTIPLSAVETTKHTHICTVGPVVYVRLQKDGDIHITLSDGKVKIVAEIIPQISLDRPKKGTVIKVCGVTRYDKYHKWYEIHPVTSWNLNSKKEIK